MSFHVLNLVKLSCSSFLPLQHFSLSYIILCLLVHLIDRQHIIYTFAFCSALIVLDLMVVIKLTINEGFKQGVSPFRLHLTCAILIACNVQRNRFSYMTQMSNHSCLLNYFRPQLHFVQSHSFVAIADQTQIVLTATITNQRAYVLE